MVLQKAFKYFNLNNSGDVDPNEFQKAIEKIGIMIPTKQVSRFFEKKFAGPHRLLVTALFLSQNL